MVWLLSFNGCSSFHVKRFSLIILLVAIFASVQSIYDKWCKVLEMVPEREAALETELQRQICIFLHTLHPCSTHRRGSSVQHTPKGLVRAAHTEGARPYSTHRRGSSVQHTPKGLVRAAHTKGLVRAAHTKGARPCFLHTVHPCSTHQRGSSMLFTHCTPMQHTPKGLVHAFYTLYTRAAHTEGARPCFLHTVHPCSTHRRGSSMLFTHCTPVQHTPKGLVHAFHLFILPCNPGGEIIGII